MRQFKIVLGVIGVFLFAGILFAEEKSEDKLVAISDSFKITQKHLSEFTGYYEKKFDFFSNTEEYRKAITRLWSFAQEAKNVGLDKEFSAKKLEDESIERLLTLQDMYINQMMEAFPVSDLAIESYYWAHPDYFYDIKDTTSTAPPLHPLTPEIRQRVKMKIAEGKKADMIIKRAEELKLKYRVRLCSEGEGVCQ